MDAFEKIRVALTQTDLVWENPKSNRINLEETINSISSEVDIIILPEMFTTGFTKNAAQLTETMTGETVQWMRQIASKKQSSIVGSIIITENSTFYNRLLFVHPSGKVDFYDKRHTFTLAKEHKVFTSGIEKRIVHYKGWKICPLICYDLRFPVWSRNVENYDLLLYVASWPKARIQAWDTLLKARAIENMSYTLGVNRVGKDGNGFEHVGHSIGIDYVGNPLSEEQYEKEDVIILELEKQLQDNYRTQLGFLNDKDAFVIKNR